MPKYMVAVERFIDAEGPAIRACGFVTRDLAHFHGVPHTSVLVVPVRVVKSGTIEILVHRRPPDKKVSPDTWDTFGGHVDVSIQDGQLQRPANKLQDRSAWVPPRSPEGHDEVLPIEDGSRLESLVCFEPASPQKVVNIPSREAPVPPPRKEMRHDALTSTDA